MLEVKLFEQDDGSVLFEAKRYGNTGEAASFTVQLYKGHLSRVTTVKEKQVTIDTIQQLQRFADLLLQEES